jgi:hypothetical protein
MRFGCQTAGRQRQWCWTRCAHTARYVINHDFHI